MIQNRLWAKMPTAGFLLTYMQLYSNICLFYIFSPDCDITFFIFKTGHISHFVLLQDKGIIFFFCIFISHFVLIGNICTKNMLQMLDFLAIVWLT